MAGEAKSNAFMLATATVMIGPQSALRTMTPALNSIGLVKNFTISSTPVYTDLTQGPTNEVVYSVMTGNPVTATMEVYEYTSRNLTYGLGLDGSALTPITISDTLKNVVTGDGTTTNFFVLNAATDTHTNYPAGTYIYAQETGSADLVFLAKVVTAVYSSSSNTLTVTVDRYIPAGMVFDPGSIIAPMNRINVGSTAGNPFLAAKIVGVLPEAQTPIVIEIPKIRIVKGFSVAFASGAFGNMPFEFKPIDLVPSDIFYSDFVGKGPVALYGKM